MIYIVMIGTPSSYSYDGVGWTIDRVFITEDSAKNYITEQKKLHGSQVEYDINMQEIYA